MHSQYSSFRIVDWCLIIRPGCSRGPGWRSLPTRHSACLMPFTTTASALRWVMSTVWSAAPRKQATLLATVMAGRKGSALGFLMGRDLQMPLVERLFLDPVVSVGYFKDNESCINGNPDFPDERTGQQRFGYIRFAGKVSRISAGLTASNSWTNVEGELDLYISFQLGDWLRQGVIALDYWTSYSPTWDQQPDGTVDNRPPSYPARPWAVCGGCAATPPNVSTTRPLSTTRQSCA